MEKKSKMDFDEFCEVYKLNQDTKEKLQSEDLTDLDNILELSPKDLDCLDIKPLGQRKALNRGIQAQREDALKCLHEKISNLKPAKTGKIIGASKIVPEELADEVTQHHDGKQPSIESAATEMQSRELMETETSSKPVGRVRPNVCTESEESGGSCDDENVPHQNEARTTDNLLVYQRPHAQTNPQDVKLLLVGITGSGKSSSGNTILSANDDNIEGQLQDYFTTAVNSAPQTCNNEFFTRSIDGRKVTIVDTPGPRNRKDNAKSICAEILNAVLMANQEKDGYNAIVYVIKIFDRGLKMNDEAINTLNLLKEMMGPDFYKYVIFLFTFGSSYERLQIQATHHRRTNPELTFEEFIIKDALAYTDNYAIGPFILEANKRAVLFENIQADSKTRKKMVLNLLEKVDEIHESENGRKFWKENLPVKNNSISCLVIIGVVVVIVGVILAVVFDKFGRNAVPGDINSAKTV